MTGTRTPTEVALDFELLAEARSMDINLSKAAEEGIARAVEKARAVRQFNEDYGDVVRSNNDYVARHGLPLRKYRSF
jgi:antitoxin CcdA